jgi:hypothetical protein
VQISGFSRETVSGWRGEERFRTVVGDPDQYRALFAGAAGAPARGEATPIYLCDPGAPDKIASHMPAARLIAILRQPVDRAYSAYLMKRRFGAEPLGFEDALVGEPRRIEEGWGFGWQYSALGRYGEQLERYYRRFSPAQIKVVLYDDLRRDPGRVMRELFAFLGVDDSFAPDLSMRHNAAYLARHRTLHRWFVRPSRVREWAKPFLPAAALGPAKRDEPREVTCD